MAEITVRFDGEACKARRADGAQLTREDVAEARKALRRAAPLEEITWVAGFPYPVGPDGWTTLGTSEGDFI